MVYTVCGLYIYILVVFSEKHYSKPLKCNVHSNSNVEHCDISEVKINHGSLQSGWMSALLCS